MSGLPKLPGFLFTDPTKARYHLSHTFDYTCGYRLPKSDFLGIGGVPLDVDGVKYISNKDPVRYDPSLTYGRSREKAPPLFLPHWALYDKKCLTFNAFFKQGVFESPNEYYRVRQVNIIYFLEDDTITVMEPRVDNSGIDQGRLIRRSKIPKNTSGEFWHWKDLQVGLDLCFYGTVFHTVNCDTFTREYMLSQGLIMKEPEEMPPDPYIQQRMFDKLNAMNLTKTPAADDKTRRFLEYDGKVLKFYALWDDRDSEYGELMKMEIFYFLAEDTVTVKQVHERNSGRDPFPTLLKKIKLPKIWTDRPVDYPSIYLEISDNEVTEFYQPKDFIVGETIYVLGRKMLLYDCDPFTRNYFKKVFCYEQKPRMDIGIDQKPMPPPERPMPPHDGIGSLEDSLQNTLTVCPKPPRKDVLRQLWNMHHKLRYTMKMEEIHPEDSIRRFILNYNLADGTCYIFEPPIRNSGIMGGKYLRYEMVSKPGSDPLNPDYYTPVDFYIGAIIEVHKQRFIITGCDLHVYRYMMANPSKFPCEVIENVRNYLYNEGHLDEDIEDKMNELKEKEKMEKFKRVGEDLVQTRSHLQECLDNIGIGSADKEYETKKRAQLVDEYEKSLEHKYKVPPHGIFPVQKTCAYPIEIGDVKSTECDKEQFPVKYEETEEEKQAKYYQQVFKTQKKICKDKAPVECMEPPEVVPADMPEEKKPEPIMVAPPEYPPGSCPPKTVRFDDNIDYCKKDRHDLCNLSGDPKICDCTKYEKC